MIKHKGKRIFITGIPTVGKSHIAKKLADAVGGIFVSSDEIRNELRADLKYKDIVNFWRNQDKGTYYRENSYEEQWKNLVAQSEALWEPILAKINSYSENPEPVIFEGVSLLPHLAKKDLDFPGIVIIGTSLDSVLERNKERPRWGDSELEIQSSAFFLGERPYYKAEAEKYGYPVFEHSDDAYNEAFKLLK